MYSIKTRTVEGVTWLYARLPGVTIQNSNRPDYIQPTLGGVEMWVGRDPTEAHLQNAVMQMEAYLHHACSPKGGPDTFLVAGYEILNRIVRPGGSSARANLPKSWAGEEVAIIRKTRMRIEEESPQPEGNAGSR